MHFTQAEADRDFFDELATSPFVTYLDDVQLSERLQSGAIKRAAIVACSDMGARLPFVHGAPEANLLIFQDFGHRTSRQELVNLLAEDNISDLIVYGHCDCEFASFLGEGPEIQQSEPMPADPENQDGLKASRCHVLNELKSVLLSAPVLRRAQSQELRLHAWVYMAKTDELEIFDPDSKRFVADPGISHGECS